MRLNSNNPAMSTATGTQKCTSVSTLLKREAAFVFSVYSGKSRFLASLGMTIICVWPSHGC